MKKDLAGTPESHEQELQLVDSDIKGDASKFNNRKWISWHFRRFDMVRTLSAHERKERVYDHMMYEGKLDYYDDFGRIGSKYADLRTNLLRKPTDYAITLATQSKLHAAITPTGGVWTPDEVKRITAEYDKRLRSIQRYTEYGDAIEEAITDACISGEGWIHTGIRMTEDRKKYEFYVEHRDWQNIWVDPYSKKPDLSDAKYLFVVAKVPLYDLAIDYPAQFSQMQAYAMEGSLSSAPLDGETGMFDKSFLTGRSSAWQGPGSSERGEHYEETALGDPVVHVIQAYMHVRDPETKGTKLWLSTFLANEDMRGWRLLSRAPFQHQHNQIPLCRITMQRDHKTGAPYSPFTRSRRGLDKAASSLLRAMIRTTSSRGMTVNVGEARKAMGGDEAKTALNFDNYMKAMMIELEKPNPIFREYGEKDSLKIHDLRAEVQQIMLAEKALMDMLDHESGIAPELMGQHSPDIAGVVLERKKEESFNIMPRLLRTIRGATRGVGRKLLSMMQQWEGQIEYGALLGPANSPMPAPHEADPLIYENKVRYDIHAQEGSRVLQRQQIDMLIPMMQQLGPMGTLAIAPIAFEMLGAPDAQRTKDMLIEIAQQLGAPVPTAILSEEQRKAAEQKANKSMQEQQQMKMLEMASAAAEVKKTESESSRNLAAGFKSIADAHKDNGSGDKVSPEEIEQFKNTIAEMHAKLQGVAPPEQPQNPQQQQQLMDEYGAEPEIEGENMKVIK